MTRYGDTRDKIALEAMRAMLTVPGVVAGAIPALARDAYTMADAMLRARETQEGSDG